MRKRTKNMRGVAAVAAAFLCAAFAYALTRSPVFDGEGYELYTGMSSAGVIVTDAPAAVKLTLPVAGESARWEGDRAAELLERFDAKVLFCEEVCGTRNYYCSSPLLGEGVLLRGVRVNLHIASDGSCTVAGTPIIFGGF